MSTPHPMNTFGWLVKREYWEHRGAFFWAPIITALVMLAFTLMGLITAEVTVHQQGININGFDLDKLTQSINADDIEKIRSAFDVSLIGLCFPIGIVLFFVLFFYGIGTLYNDRADRSVLFWKSLPFSDTETVLSKVATISLLAPALAVASMILLQIGFLLLMTLYAMMHGINAFGILWSPQHVGALWMKLILRIPINSLWAIPSVGWLFLVSSFVRSKPFLWAVAVPVVAGLIVWWFGLMRTLTLPSFWFWKHIVARLLLSLVPGSWLWSDMSPSVFENAGKNPQDFTDSFLGLHTLGLQLMSPEMWIGVVAGAAMIAASIYFRRKRVEAYA